MKYIRTEKGIYEVEEIKKYFLDEKQKLFINNTMKIAINENKVIKQADTIEELCDMFVLADDEFKHVDLVSDYNDARQMLSYDLFGQSCYGAIWTKDGLKFVAKKNCFGELELI